MKKEQDLAVWKRGGKTLKADEAPEARKAKSVFQNHKASDWKNWNSSWHFHSTVDALKLG